ncbi:hypothetical protein H8A95_18380 [Bradyrhizobium sp. Pear76]|uniref:hypothetical protein n=1 Tax=Bradyrhizobium oropedii TaxID=1571201 RepID=UPI001E5D54EE|nr:hypothetical protein [Bradyrhizobium oropedii]MCC8964232.1 hypothetical protein [Bradyrhizobium oropedii]
MHHVFEDELQKIRIRDRLSPKEARVLLRTIRHGEQKDEVLAYAETLVVEADFLSPYSLRALVRADITEAEAAREIKKNKAFCNRLAGLLPSILRLFGSRDNLTGICSMIDDCHHDYQVTTISPRKDRQTRETRERLARAVKASLSAAKALEEAKRFLDIEFDRFGEAYRHPEDRPRRLEELIDELRMCSGVGEIVNAIVDVAPQGPFKSLFLSGNDARTTVVEYAYHMCTMWDGPKLLTTPGSQFADLCSFLFEAVSGHAEESLSGAINRYARSDERKHWDREGEEEDDEHDNFVSQKRKMRASQRELQLYKAVARYPGLSQMAKTLLILRLNGEADRYQATQSAYGPNQVYLEQLNSDQVEAMFTKAIQSWRPDKRDELFEFLESGFPNMAALDVKVGKTRRAARKSGN